MLACKGKQGQDVKVDTYTTSYHSSESTLQMVFEQD